MDTEILDLKELETTAAPTEFVIAERSKRFFNLLIDTILFYIFFIAMAVVFALLDNVFASSYTVEMLDAPILGRIISVIIYFIFFFLMEWALKGRTIGKYITNTKTVMEDGSRLTLSAILKKSGSRLVPFEAFSFFGSDGRGIHDKWSDTVVVDLKKVKIENSRQVIETSL